MTAGILAASLPALLDRLPRRLPPVDAALEALRQAHQDGTAAGLPGDPPGWAPLEGCRAWVDRLPGTDEVVAYAYCADEPGSVHARMEDPRD